MINSQLKGRGIGRNRLLALKDTGAEYSTVRIDFATDGPSANQNIPPNM